MPGTGTSEHSDRRAWRRTPRKPEPRIVDPATHPVDPVNISVAADFLKIDRKAVYDYIDDGSLTVKRRGRMRRIALAELIRFRRWLDLSVESR